ncbi:MAG: NADH-quinone oxidoreductase subunit J [bacterium]
MTADLGETVAFGIIAAVILGSGLASSMVKRTFHSVMFLGVTLVSVASLFILLGSPLIGVIQILVYVGGILTLFVFAVMFVAGDEKEADAYVAPPRSSAWGILAGVAMVPLVMWWAFGGLFGLPKVLPSVFDIYVKAANLLARGVDNWPGQGAGFTASILYLVFLVVAAIVIWLGVRHVVYNWTPQRILGVVVSAVILGLLLAIAMGTTAWQASPTDANQTAANDLDSVVTLLFSGQVVALEVLGVLLTAVMIGALVIARPMTGMADKDRYSAITRAEVTESQRASDPSLHPTAAEVGK